MAAFLDTNVVVYAFLDDPRSGPARELLKSRCIISVQVLNEFVHVARRKLDMTWEEVQRALSAIRAVCLTVLPVGLDTHVDAVAIAQRYDFRIFDALLVAAALDANCETFWSEDMHDGLLIRDQLRITNPFRSA